MQNPISLTVRLQNSLSQQSLRIRCQEISQILHEVSSKDSGLILRTIIESLFGVNESNVHQSVIGGGWGIRIITVSEHRTEFEALRHFLSPRGPLLTLIYRLSHDPFLLLPFPISLLPTKVKTEIQEETAGAFYTSKIHNAGPGKMSTNIMLNAFEFYMYHFGHFLISNCPQRWNLSWTSVRDSLYPTLLEDYLASFLSCDSSLPPGPPSPPMSPRGILSPVTQRTLHSPGNNLSLFGVSTIHQLRHPELQSDHGSQPIHCHSTTEINVWTSHILVQVLMEIWINLCVSPPKLMVSLPSITATSNSMHDVFLPSGDHVRAVRMLIKHFHYFANSFKSNQSSPLDPLRRNILTMSRKSFYFFLKHLFTHWPLDSSFRLVLETWLSYIQPWRYISYSPNERTPVKSNNETEGPRPIDACWKEFIAENLLFYTHLFHLLMKRALRLDLSSFKNAQILFRVAKVFSQESLISMLYELESLLESIHMQKSFLGCISNISSTPVRDNCDSQLSPQTLLQLIKSHVMEVEMQTFNYTPIFSRQSTKDIYRILHMMKEAHNSLHNELHLHSLGRKTTNHAKGKLEFLKSLFQGIFEPFPVEDENSVDEMQRCQTHLDITYKLFVSIFKIEDTDYSLLDLSSNNFNDSFALQENPNEFTDIGCNLTNYGRHQILTGTKRLDLKYDGDPELKPICTFEVPFLVRRLYNLTNLINTKFEAEIVSWFYRRDYVGSIGRVILTPPMTIYEYQKDNIDSPRRRIARDLPPRMGLRALANKKVIIFLIMIFAVFSVCGVSVWKVLIQLMAPFIVTYVLCKAALQKRGSPTLSINRGKTAQ